MNLIDIANYMYLFGNDLRFLHLNCSGHEFLSLHPYLNDLYDKVFDYYDQLAEIAKAHGDKITNPSNLINEYTNWTFETSESDTGNLNYDIVIGSVIGRVQTIFEILNKAIEDKIDEKYDPSVLSLFDEIVTYLTQEVLYKLKQSM